MTVAVLFARRDSCYKTLPDCDVWDEDRDALNWLGGMPVIAHPPCRAWGQLRHFAKPKPGEKDLALWAMGQVRRCGGVLEHPKNSRLWAAAECESPGVIDRFGGFTFPVFQSWWGHRAEKATVLYIVGCALADIPQMPIVLGEAPAVCGTSGRRKDGKRKTTRPEITKAEREHTPIEFAKWLVEVARSSERKLQAKESPELPI